MFNFNNKKPDIIEFFHLYPKIIPKIDNEDTLKYLRFFHNPNNDDNDSGLKEYLSNEEINSKPKLLKSKSIINNDQEQFIKSLTKSKRRSINWNNNSLSQKNLILSFDNKIYGKENSNEKDIDKILEEEKNDNYFLIKKGILLQNTNLKRTEDVRKALELFLLNSKFIEKLSNNLNLIESRIKNSKRLLGKDQNINDDKIQSKIKNKLNNIVLKLSKRVMIKNYPSDNFVVKMNEIGEDCYFLISGKLSILKPVEYKDLKVSYREYFIYIKNLLNLDEIDLVLKVLNENKKFLDITNIDEISKLIRSYFVISLKKELSKKIEGITMDELESFFNIYKFTLEDFQLSKKKIFDDVKGLSDKAYNSSKLLWNYISDKIAISHEDIYIVELYKVFNYEREKKTSSVTLYKYEIFLFLYPGSFFGDSALESKIRKRNATIRTEEDCIICSLSNEYYISLLSEENRKLKTLDLIFLCHNFFFEKISPVLFNKYYYHMFKVMEKFKNDIIYKQDENITSVFLLKEGIIKMEIYANIKDLMDLIRLILKEIYMKNNSFKINLEQILELRHNYLYDQNFKKMKSKDNLLLESNNKINFEIFSSNGYECLGIQEFCLKMKYMTTCTVISDKALLMEIKKEDLSKMIQNESEILPSYYKFVFTKLLSFIKRIHYLKSNAINQINNSMKENKLNKFYKEQLDNNTKDKSININLKGNNNHKQKIEILKPDKMKNIYNEKINSLESVKINNNLFTLTDKNFFSAKNKNSSTKSLISFKETCNSNNTNNKKYAFKKINLKNKRKAFSGSNQTPSKKDLILSSSKNNDINSTMSFSKIKNIKYKNKILSKNDKSNNLYKVHSALISTKKGYISLNQIKENNILFGYKEQKGSGKFSFVNKIFYPFDEEKSIQDFSLIDIKQNNKKRKYKIINLNKYMTVKNYNRISNDNNVFLSKDEDYNSNNTLKLDAENNTNRINQSAPNIKIKDTINSINYKNTKESENIYTKRDILNSTRASLPSIKYINKKIKNLIGEMKKNYAISMGQKKFIFYRKSRKNKAFNSMKVNHCNSFRQKSVGQTIKDYYLRKKIEGYSSLINPMHNTYINRQKTIRVKEINK